MNVLFSSTNIYWKALGPQKSNCPPHALVGLVLLFRSLQVTLKDIPMLVEAEETVRLLLVELSFSKKELCML